MLICSRNITHISFEELAKIVVMNVAGKPFAILLEMNIVKH